MMRKVFAIILAMVILTPIYASAETASVNFEDTTLDIDYSGQNMSILGIQPDMGFISLIIDVEVTDSPATLEITLPRNFIDSKINGEDEPYIVLEDGFDIPFEEVETTSDYRTLRIEMSEGSEEIEIIGTEFGEPQSAEEVSPPPPPPSSSETPIEEPEGTPATEEPIAAEEEEKTTMPETEKPKDTVPPKTEEEMPVEKEKPKLECGPGTVLKDGKCVIPQECGPGTVFKDGKCVASPKKEPATTTLPPGREMVMGIMGAFVIGGAVAFILWLISRGSRSKPNTSSP